MYLSELMDENELQEHIDQGYVSLQLHPSLPLGIVNYTAKTQYEQKWNDVTSWSRGLIVDESGKIIGLPFKKFHNYEPGMEVSGSAIVTDKMDGSLGIICMYNDNLVVATRGSFVSTMAQWAYDHVVSNYMNDITRICQPDVTMLVEIIYPENRIVVDYGNFSDIVLLGVHDHGKWISADDVDWPGSKTTTFDVNSLQQALDLPVRDGKEGLVVYFPATDYRVKIKYAEYIEIHRAVFNLNKKEVWRTIMAGNLRKLMDTVPDEFHSYIINVATELRQQVIQSIHEAMATYTYAMNRKPSSRADFYSLVGGTNQTAEAMLLYDRQLKKLNDRLWKKVEPKGNSK
jgi:RNA ligase